MTMLKKGLIQVYTGNSDYTNFAPFGLSLRAAGQNLRTHITCFLPHEYMEGASMAAIFLKPHLVIEYLGHEKMQAHGRWDREIINKINQSFQNAEKALHSGEFDIVILHGINQLLKENIVSRDHVLELMRKKPDNVELVLTGPNANEEMIEQADLVTEMVVNTLKDKPAKDYHDEDMAPIEVVTGNGKGKTTYCMGKAMLMSCMGIRSTILQFIKSPKSYGEVKAMKRLPYLGIRSMGKGFLNIQSAASDKKHREAARKAWEDCLREIFSLKYGLIVLDEINIATYYGLIHTERVREMLFLKPRKLHLILSGRNAHLEVREGASWIVEMREIKHPFRKGIKARKGIEF